MSSPGIWDQDAPDDWRSATTDAVEEQPADQSVSGSEQAATDDVGTLDKEATVDTSKLFDQRLAGSEATTAPIESEDTTSTEPPSATDRTPASVAHQREIGTEHPTSLDIPLDDNPGAAQDVANEPGGDDSAAQQGIERSPSGDLPTEDEEWPRAWRGAFEAYSIGEPGRAATNVVPRLNDPLGALSDTVVDGITLEYEDEPALVLRAASTRGLSHRHEGTVRQDAYGFTRSPDDEYLVAVVADGVSSGPLSHHAAWVATTRGTGLLAEAVAQHGPDAVPWRSVLADGVVTQMERATAHRLRRDTVDLRDVGELMATTIVIAVISIAPDATRRHHVWVTRIGDSSAWIVDAEGRWHALGDVKNEGATIAESTTGGLPYLPPDELPVVKATVGAGEFLALISDGIGDPLGAGRGEVGRSLAELWATPPAPLQFAAQVDFARKTFDDDRTALAVWPIGLG